MSAPLKKIPIWPVALYPFASCLFVGFVSTWMGLPVPSTGSRAFADVFLAHALRFPGDFDILRWLTLALGWICLLLMALSLRSRKPIVTAAEVRIVLLVLIVVITLIIQVFLVVGPHPERFGLISREDLFDLTFYTFLFVDCDLILAFVLTFLPVFKPLKRRMVADPASVS